MRSKRIYKRPFLFFESCSCFQKKYRQDRVFHPKLNSKFYFEGCYCNHFNPAKEHAGTFFKDAMPDREREIYMS